MNLRIARARVLLAILAALIVAATAVTVVATGDDDPPVLIPVAGPEPTPVLVTTGDLDRVRQIIVADGRLDRLTGGQPFQFEQVRADASTGGEKLVVVAAVWAGPVDSRGPWLVRKCQNTVTFESDGLWRNLRSTTIDVDLAIGRVVGFGPGGTAIELGGTLDQSSVGRSKAPACSEGKSDD